MKHFINIVPLILFLSLTFCSSPKSEKNSNEEKLIAELTDTWSQVNNDSLRLNDQNLNIKSVQLVNDSIAEVQIIDSSGERIVTGTWKFKINKRKKLDIEIISDIDIIGFHADNHPYELLIKYGKENEKLIMIPIVFINENLNQAVQKK